MIILDMNQISLANLMMNFHMNKSTELEEDMGRERIIKIIKKIDLTNFNTQKKLTY